MNRLQTFFTIILLLFVSFLPSGCGTFGVYNPATGRNEFIAISTSTEIAMGQDIHNGMQSQYDFSARQEQQTRLNRIGQRLALICDRQDYEYHFFVIEKDEINAFTTPGGHIYVYSGLMDKLKTDDQIAAVVAHEMGHCAARHIAKKFQAVLGYDLIGTLLLSQIDMQSQARNIAKLSSSVVMNIVLAAFSRKDEYEADRLGVKYLYLAGYDVQGMVETLTFIEEESKGPSPPLIIRTHPYVKDRIIEVKKEIEDIRIMYGQRV